MEVKPYSHITKIYQHLMEQVSYSDWSDYLIDIVYSFNLQPKNALEFGCGFAELSTHLLKEIPDITVSDLEPGFLKNIDNRLTKVCCDMRYPSFKKKYELIYTIFDSINYLISEEDMIKFFSNIALLLEKDGMFTFDASLEQNSIENVGYLNRSGIHDGIEYVQESIYDEKEKLHYNNFTIRYDGNDYIEKHVQRVYHFVDYFYLLEEAGLMVVDCYDAFTFDTADENCERVQFVVRGT